MKEPQQVEEIDQIMCVRHNNPISVVSFEEGVKFSDQFLCGQCSSEVSRIFPNQLSCNILKTKIYQQQQKRKIQIQSQLKPMLDYIQNFENVIEYLRKKMPNIDQIVQKTISWKKQITGSRFQEYKYNIISELNILKRKSQESCLIKVQYMEKLLQCAQAFINYLCFLLKETTPSQELSFLEEIIRTIQACMEYFAFYNNTDEDNFEVCNENFTIKCNCPQHNNQITMINLDKNINRNKRTLYSDTSFQIQKDKLIKIKIDIVQIIKQMQVAKSELPNDFSEIEIFLETLIQNRITITDKQQINQTYNNNLGQMQEELSSYLIKQNSEFDDIQYYHNKQLLLLVDKINKSFNTFIQRVIKTTECNQIEPKFISTKQSLDQVPEIRPITYQLVGKVNQKQQCLAVAFNNNGTVMAAGQGTQIKLWGFENGSLKATGNLLSGHTNNIWCIVFSKNQNWFASGSMDRTIQCWKESQKNEWVRTRSQNRSSVSSLLLNRNDEQLFSCDCDNLIKIWKVDCNHNILTFNYSLNKHTGYIFCISLNDSETSLVSCGYDKTIIVWGKEQLRWEFKYYITQSIQDYGHRICFINDNIIAWQQQGQGITHIFELDHEIFKEKLDQQISLNQVGYDGEGLFPSVYNKKRNILVQKHNKYVYIIRQQNDGKFKVESQPIDCNVTKNYGGLTNDGEHLIIWNDQTMQFIVYRINDI